MYYLVKNTAWLIFKLIFGLKVEGRGNIPKDTVVIYASNHRSNADPPLLAGVVRGKCSFMAKEELFRNKLFGAIIRHLGAFPVSRGKGDTKVLDTAVERLEKGENLMIFPEGTRSKDGKVQRGHSGAAVIAARSNKPLIPIGIIFGEKLKFRCGVTVRIGEPIQPSDYIDDPENPNPRQLVKLKNRYMAEIKRLVEGEPENAEVTENA